MNVLITGASGFVGRQILKALNKTDHKLVPVVRTGKEFLGDAFCNIERVVSTPDLFAEDANWWKEQCQDVDMIIHAAWYAEPGRYLKAPQNIDCLIGSLNLAKGAAASGVNRFVGIGSCLEYDLSQGVLSINTSLKPSTPYAAAKAAVFLSLSEWLPSQSIEFAWCRLFYLYGENEDERRLVAYIKKQLRDLEPVELTSGEQVRDYLDVAEAGQRIVDIALGKAVGAYNICSGVPVTVKQVAEQIADEFGRRDLLRFGAKQADINDPICIIGKS